MDSIITNEENITEEPKKKNTALELGKGICGLLFWMLVVLMAITFINLFVV